ncbi:hypothetical protein M3P21_17100 [Ruegeria sp. 2012CJ41-6]|uniref:Calcium-binding protein n=1 Tax=Ruegeria spongiae TaxID=2942209 RepID=A0ABT0Q5V8_9RHOB|nr:hypothetical protein [Ruegeria spongiae]MCL6285249.1 hypothetical protein [Ruegeria spongiae]
MKLGSDGELVATDYVIDTLHSRFGGVQAVAMLETGGHVFVVAGGSDDGFSLFSLLPNGRLVHAATLVHCIGLGLEDVTALEIVRVGDELQIFAASEGADGLSQFTVPLDTLGQVIRDTDPAGQILAGTAGDDVILASPGGLRDWIRGAGGDDTLVAGSGGSDLTGGAGRDVFVIGVGESGHHIRDFEPGRDRLDLGSLPFLRSSMQLDYQRLADGALLQYADTDIRVTSASGRSLALSELWPGRIFAHVDHYPVGEQTPGRTKVKTGSAGADRIKSTADNEEVTLGAGADVFALTWNMGADTVTDFDPSEDLLDFSVFTAAERAVILSSQSGADRILRMPDASLLTLQGVGVNAAPTGDVSWHGWVGQGKILRADISTLHDADGVTSVTYQWYRDGQKIPGATGNAYKLIYADVGHGITVLVSYLDRLGTYETVRSASTGPVVKPRITNQTGENISGSAGRDFIISGDGRDTVAGFSGNDTLWGGAHADSLLGGLGHDIIRGGVDNDTVFGGIGDDMLEGNGGLDQLFGGDGQDWISGGSSRDTLIGGGGRDTLKGEDHADSLSGGAGADELWGGQGR